MQGLNPIALNDFKRTNKSMQEKIMNSPLHNIRLVRISNTGLIQWGGNKEYFSNGEIRLSIKYYPVERS